MPTPVREGRAFLKRCNTLLHGTFLVLFPYSDGILNFFAAYVALAIRPCTAVPVHACLFYFLSSPGILYSIYCCANGMSL